MSSSNRKRRVPRASHRNRGRHHRFHQRTLLVAMAAVLLVVLAGAAFLTRIWIVTPRGLDPVVRIRGLDFVQAAILRRSAARLGETARYGEAMLNWRRAVEKNPGDPRAIRGALKNLTQIEPPAQGWIGWGFQYAKWLLRVAQTNQDDVALFARVMEHYEFDEGVVSLLGPTIDKARGDQIAPYLRSLFNLGRFDRFDEVWRRFEGKLPVGSDLALFRAAYLAGWGPSLTAAGAMLTLDNARGDPEWQVLANRLILPVCEVRNAVEEYRAALGRLEADRADRARDHVHLWLLLAVNRRPEEARALAKQFVMPPTTPLDAEILTRGLLELGLRDEALATLEQHHEQFDYSPAIWVLRSQLLAEAGRWGDLWALAADRRNRERLVQLLGGYHHFLLGLAEHRLGRKDAAAESFRELERLPIADPVLAYASAMTLSKLGQSDLATGMLDRLEHSFSNNIDFWLQVQSVAQDSRQFDMLLTASRMAYQISPSRIEYANHYAAALLVSREHRQEAMELTELNLKQAPHAFETRMNQALALLQNSRVDEAEPILHDLDDERRDAERDTLVSLGWFEFYLAKQDPAHALEAATRIQVRYLQQPQADWFNRSRRTLEAKEAG